MAANKRWRPVAVCAVAVVLGAGCSSGGAGLTTSRSPAVCVCAWPVYRGDNARDGHPGGLALTAAQARGLKVGWADQLDGPIDGSPIAASSQGRSLVIATTEAGEIAVVSENTGKLFWKHTGLGKFSGSPAVEAGRVIAATLTGHVYAFDIDDGSLFWDWTASGVQPGIWSSPIVAMANAYYFVLLGIGSQYGDQPLEPGRVIALRLESGKVAWSFCIEANCAPGGGVWSSVAIDGAQHGFVGTGNPDDGVIAFKVATGEKLWATSLNADEGRDLDVGATPVVLNVGGREAVAVGSNGGVFAELDAVSGTVIWSKALVAGSAVHGLIASPAYDGTSIYAASASPPTGVFALDPETGKVRWQRRTNRPVYSAPAVGDGVVIFGTGDVFGDPHQGELLGLATPDGSVLWSYDVHSSVFSSPAIVATTVIVGDTRGDLLAFIPS